MLACATGKGGQIGRIEFIGVLSASGLVHLSGKSLCAEWNDRRVRFLKLQRQPQPLIHRPLQARRQHAGVFGQKATIESQ